jgi:hypothetical protein
MKRPSRTEISPDRRSALSTDETDSEPNQKHLWAIHSKLQKQQGHANTPRGMDDNDRVVAQLTQ